MDEHVRARQVVERMMASDAFSQWLGIERVHEAPGLSVLRLQVRPDMVNGFGIAHGGITFSLADSALAFASNSHGKMAVSVDTSINHLLPVHVGDVLEATATEVQRGGKLAHYRVDVRNQRQELVAIFQGMVYLRHEHWEVG